MTTFMRLTGIFAIITLMAGCAASHKQMGSADALLPEIDVVQVKEKSDEALKLAQEAKLDIEVLTTRLTELDSRVIALSEEIASISSAKIEELETRLALLTEAYKDLLTQVKQAETVALKRSRSGTFMDTGATFAPSSASSLLVSPEYVMYQKGLKLYNARNFDQTILAFSELMQEFPLGKYRNDAHFWIAESYYALANYSSAVSFYQKVIETPSSSKADDAQYKIGLAYLKMGQQSLAKDALKMLVDRYPGSDYVQRAEKQLKTLK
jgi:tol-pal system protein YbgF